MNNKQKIIHAYIRIVNFFESERKHFSTTKVPSSSDKEWGKITEDLYYVKKEILEEELQKIGLNFNDVKKAWGKSGYIRLTAHNGYCHQRSNKGIKFDIIIVKKPSSPQIIKLLASEEPTTTNENLEVKKIIKSQVELLHEKSTSTQISTRELIELSKVMASLCVEYFGRL